MAKLGPIDPGLWTLEHLEEFIEARKQLIVERFRFMLHGVEDKAA